MSLTLLEDLKKYQFSKPDIDMLTWWLQTRKRNTWKYLNPLQYSVDCNINIEIALNLFLTCSLYDDVKVFDVRAVARCPNCNSVISKTKDSLSVVSIPEECEECSMSIEESFMDEYVEIYFSLIADPLPPSSTPNLPMGVNKVKSNPLTLDQIKKTPSSKSFFNRMRRLNNGEND